MASYQNGPVATRLVLLSDLADLPPASKVRFLGWSVLPFFSFTATFQKSLHILCDWKSNHWETSRYGPGRACYHCQSLGFK